jgi:hypothetical protein
VEGDLLNQALNKKELTNLEFLYSRKERIHYTFLSHTDFLNKRFIFNAIEVST